MAQVQHRDQSTTNGIHVAARWQVANSAARSALSVAAPDLTGVCYQLDTKELYDLIGVSPTVWQRRALDLAVATPSALATIDDAKIDDRSRVRIACYLDDADLLKDSALPLHPQLVWATMSGVGRWVRRLQPNRGVWLGQTAWRIDSSIGSDDNSGKPEAPLQTYAELWRRWSGAGSSVHHTVSKTVDVVSLLSTDGFFGRYTTAPDVIVNIRAVLPTPAFSGSVSGKADYQAVTAPGTTSKVTSTWVPATERNRLVRDVTNNRWAFVDLDLGGGQAKLSPWADIDVVNGGTSITTGDTTFGASIETYVLPVVAATCNIWADSVRTGQLISVLVQGFEFTGQQSLFGGAKLCLQNCKLGNVRYGSGPINLNNCWSLNGAMFIDGPSPFMVWAAGLQTGGLANNANSGGAVFDLRNGVICEGAQIFMNRLSLLRLRDVFFENFGGATCVVLTDGAQCVISASNVCGNGNAGAAFDVRGNSKVGIVGTAVSQCKLTTGTTQFLLNGTATTNAFDPTTAAISAPRSNTFANIDATYASGGFGGSALELRTGAGFGQVP